MRMPLHWTALLLGVLAVAPFAAEAALRLYASYVSKRDRLFRSDAQTGWSNAPNLLTTRINAAGEEWSIRTDQNGQRLIAQNPRARRRILILGNSLSFGEGIDIKDRFDVKMLSSLPGARVINTGTMGYGTDQEYVAFRNWKHLLESGDTVLIVLNQSDYFDVLRRRFFGRAKPYFEKVDGSYVLRPPPIGLWERWSDWSRVASVVARFIEPSGFRELGSQSIDRNHPLHPRSNPRRSAARRESGPGPSGHPRFPRTEARPFLDDLLPICGCLHRSRRRAGRRSGSSSSRRSLERVGPRGRSTNPLEGASRLTPWAGRAINMPRAQ